MAVQKAVGKVTENAGEEQAKGELTPWVGWLTAEEKDSHNHECDARESDEEAVVIREGAEGGAGVSHMDKRKEIWNDDRRLGGIDETQDEILSNLIERVEWQREQEQDLQAIASTTSAQRSQRSG